MQSTKPAIAKLDPDEVERDARLMVAGLRDVARRQMFKLIAVLLALLTGSAVAAFHFGNGLLGLFGVVVSVVAYLEITKGSRRRQMGVALPSVLRTLGLGQDAEGMEFNRSLPARLFPRVAEPVVSTVFSGVLGDFPIAIAEVRVTDRTADSNTAIFEGLVLRVGLSGALPDFVLLDEALSRKMEGSSSGRWLFGKPYVDVGVLKRSKALPQEEHGLGLWLETSDDPLRNPLAAILKVLSCPPPDARLLGRIHSATNDKATVFVALRPDDAPGRIDWTSAPGPAANLVIHVTYQWLAQPMALATALIAATDQTAAKS